MRGLMQDSPLTIDTIFRHVEQHYGDATIVTNNPSGITRATYAEWAQRTRRLGGVLDTLGISGDGRRSTAELGKKLFDMKVDYAVRQIQQLVAAK